MLRHALRGLDASLMAQEPKLKDCIDVFSPKRGGTPCHPKIIIVTGTMVHHSILGYPYYPDICVQKLLEMFNGNVSSAATHVWTVLLRSFR